MADRLANNRGTPFNPDRELWGQGWVQVVTPLLNGFPCTGALIRTAVSIKVGAVTPLAGYFKGVIKLALAVAIAPYLESMPLACIAGLLLWVAGTMFSFHEVRAQARAGIRHLALMVYTAVMVPTFDFLTAVLSALLLHAAINFFTRNDALRANARPQKTRRRKCPAPTSRVSSFSI
jgi:MFS superfamily sulfate permease-like transporter